MRGNLRGNVAAAHRLGAIPACAGEPRGAATSTCRCRGHPRVCGGTGNGATVAFPFAGPSPRVRGNPRKGRQRKMTSGAIPACAGEPQQDAAPQISGRGHPRVCGGTPWLLATVSTATGPSPRVRGNHQGAVQPDMRRGAIPACAGEPSAQLPPAGGQGGHPRVCGGTKGWELWLQDRQGPSPRVRGNRGGSEQCRHF